jgi:hypothetical protein
LTTSTVTSVLRAACPAIVSIALAACATAERKPPEAAAGESRQPVTQVGTAATAPPAPAAPAAAAAPATPAAPAAANRVVVPSSTAIVKVKASIPNPVPPGASFYVTVRGVDVPKNGGATLKLTWNKAVVSANSVELAPGSPFDYLEASSVQRFTFASISKNTCESGPCSFDAVRINFKAVGPGSADIALVDDSFDSCWGDPETFVCLTNPPTYPQTHVTVGKPPSGKRKP